MVAISSSMSLFEVDIVDQMDTKIARKLKYVDLYEHLEKHYNRKNKAGTTAFEYFDASTTWVKPHFDVDRLLDEEPDNLTLEEIKTNFIQTMGKLMSNQEDISQWAIAGDSRYVYKKEKDPKTGKMKSKLRYKISYHFVLWSKKCNFEKFGYWLKTKLSQLPPEHGIDMKIYRRGINKFRLPMTKKSADDTESILIPHNFTDIDEFHRHLVQITDYCTEFEMPDVPENYHLHLQISNKDRVERQIYLSDKKSHQEIESIIQSFRVISQNHDHESGSIFYDIAIQENQCGQLHHSNHNYLIYNTNYNTLKLKCHSEKCVHFERILYEEKAPTLHFDINYFLNIPIPDGKKDNYLEAKKYFEQFFVFVRDTNSYYRKRYEYNQKYRYYEKEMKPINITGYTKDFFYKEITEDNKSDESNQIKSKSFFKRYEVDPYKHSYLGICFQPYGIHSALNKIANFDYNLFEDFNYKTVLAYQQKNDIPPQKLSDFQFLIRHIRYHICGLANAKKSQNPEFIKVSRASFDYLMYYLANIIQDPTVVPQIIVILFSKIHGTGKSGFTKFISNVIGENLCYFGSYQQIMEKHTNAHVGKLINIIEEVDKYLSKKYHNAMKDFSQRDRAVYNEKNKPQFNIKTFVRYFKTTNYQDGVWFDKEDRRYVLYSFDKISDPNYVKKLLSIMDDPYIIYLFGDYLEKVQIPFQKLNDWETNRPLTADYFTMRSEDPITEFVRDLLKLEGIVLDHLDTMEYFNLNQIDHDTFGDEHVGLSKETLYQLFVRFYDDNNCMNKKYKNKVQFFRHLSANFKNEITVQKFYNHSQKDYYVFNLEKLWHNVLPHQPFTNYHFRL